MVNSSHLVLLILAIAVGYFVRHNPILFGMKAETLSSASDEFTVYRDHPLLDAVLNMHKSEIGQDYESYRNHCLRVLSFAVYHLGGKKNLQPGDLNVIAIALAYHDIGLWTPDSGTLNYLEPSVGVMEREMKQRILSIEAQEENQIFPADFLSETDIATVREIILQHHKYREWTTTPEKDNNPADARLVNAVRKGDWADATVGIIRYGLPANYLQAAYISIPEAGFHMVLAGMGSRLSPDSLVGQLDVLKIFKW
jgi:hypothetical protein